MKKIALGIISAAVVIGALVFLLLRPSAEKGAALSVREEAMKALGARIAELRPGAGVLVLSNPFSREAGWRDDKGRFERAGLNGLREGLGRRARVEVVFPEVRREYFENPGSILIPPDSRTPLSFLIQPQSVQQLAEAHADCPVIVSLIGLPVGVEELGVWDAGDSRAFALLLPDLRVLGDPAKALEAFERGKILAVVSQDGTTGAPVVITRENAAQALRESPEHLGF